MLSVVIPLFNEERNVAGLLARLVPVLEGLGISFEMVFVNDGSRDATVERLVEARTRERRIRIVDLSRNFGKESALSAGLAHARGEAVVSMDGDLQHPPETIPALVAEWRKGAEMVYAVRDTRAGQGSLYRLLARAFYLMFHHLSDVKLPAEAGDFRLMSRSVVDAINAMPERHRFMKGIFAWVGFRQASVIYRQEARREGVSKWRFFKLLRFAIDGLTAFSVVPLRIWGMMGAIISGFAFLYIVIRLVRFLVYGIDVPGYESIIVTILFLGGVQLLSLGVLGAYLGRVFEEVKGRPLYLVRQVWDTDDEPRS